MEIALFGNTKAKYLMSKMDQRKHIYRQNQNKIFYVYDGLMEIDCISKNKFSEKKAENFMLCTWKNRADINTGHPN